MKAARQTYSLCCGRIASVILSICFLVSCSKPAQEDCFNFSVEGGPKYFHDVEMEGSSLAIEAEKESGTAEYWPEASIDADGLWCAEISWAYVSYQPSKQVLFVRVDRNGTGSRRYLRISAVSRGKTKLFHIGQAGY